MSGISQRTLLIAGVPVLVIAAFALGYVVGGRNQPAPATVSSTASGEMGGEFGNRTPLSMSPGTAMSPGTSMSPMPTSPMTPMPPAISAHKEPQAAGLGSLVAGLEKKVAANPDNLNQQVLLARTYKELGQRGKGIAQLRPLHQKYSTNADISAALADLLMTGTNKTELQEAFQLFDDVAREQPSLASVARLRQGEIQVKLGDTPRALKIWREQLSKLPKGDEERAVFEQQIAQNSGK